MKGLSRARKMVIGIAGLVMIVGLGMLAYPTVQQLRYAEKARGMVEEFEQRRPTQSPQESQPYPQLRAAMEAYNQDLWENGQAGFKDAWSYQPASFDLAQWGIPDEMVGYIRIPRLDTTLPIYLGASKENMEKGAVHLTQTSLPIGGENSNCVIAGHRGSLKGDMFRHIQRMEVGDQVFITNLWETLTYQVVETKIIQPNQTQEVMIQPGQDLVTLVTCHPYPYRTQRYVVYCQRVEQGQSSPAQG